MRGKLSELFKRSLDKQIENGLDPEFRTDEWPTYWPTIDHIAMAKNHQALNLPLSSVELHALAFVGRVLDARANVERLLASNSIESNRSAADYLNNELQFLLGPEGVGLQVNVSEDVLERARRVLESLIDRVQ
jgi:hypothetical protein